MIIHVPHADPTIPSDLRHQFILSGAELDAEVLCSTDWFTDELFSGRKRHMVRFPVSRLVVDPERFEDDGSERMSAVGRGVIYQRTQDGRPLRRQLNPAERKALLDRYYHPHHSNLAAAVQSELTRSGRALIVDAHSFPQEPWAVEPNRDTRRPDFCIGTDPFHTPVPLTRLAMGYLAGNGLSVFENVPYGGSIVPIEWYQKDPRVASIMIEVNRRTYMDETTGKRIHRFAAVRSVLAWLCDALSGLSAAVKR